MFTYQTCFVSENVLNYVLMMIVHPNSS